MKKLFIACTLFFTTALSSANAGMFDLKAKTTTSDFDGKTMVTMQPTGFTCKQWTFICPMLGYAWFKDLPDEIVLRVQVLDMAKKDYYQIKSFRMNIDGEIIQFPFFGDGLTSYDHDSAAMTTSTNTFKAPFDLTKKLNDAKSVKIQIITNNGIFEDVMKGGDKQTKADKYLQVFLDEVAKNK